MSEAEAKALLRKLLSQGLGISGHQVFNGADFCRCSACLNRTEVIGHASFSNELRDVEHEPDCGLIKLAEWAGFEV